MRVVRIFQFSSFGVAIRTTTKCTAEVKQEQLPFPRSHRCTHYTSCKPKLQHFLIQPWLCKLSFWKGFSRIGTEIHEWEPGNSHVNKVRAWENTPLAFFTLLSSSVTKHPHTGFQWPHVCIADSHRHTRTNRKWGRSTFWHTNPYMPLQSTQWRKPAWRGITPSYTERFGLINPISGQRGARRLGQTHTCDTRAYVSFRICSDVADGPSQADAAGSAGCGRGPQSFETNRAEPSGNSLLDFISEALVDPDGCPWNDLKQKHPSISNHTMIEVTTLLKHLNADTVFAQIFTKNDLIWLICGIFLFRHK